MLLMKMEVLIQSIIVQIIKLPQKHQLNFKDQTIEEKQKKV